MLLTLIVIVVVSGALVAGAALGIYSGLSDEAESFLVALARGALLISAVLELIEPATRMAPVWVVLLVVLVGAAAFSGLDYLVDERWGSDNGGGLLAASTLDGIPENLALGVALISTGPLQVAALSGSILLSNLPEAPAAPRPCPAVIARTARCSACGDPGRSARALRTAPRRPGLRQGALGYRTTGATVSTAGQADGFQAPQRQDEPPLLSSSMPRRRSSERSGRSAGRNTASTDYVSRPGPGLASRSSRFV